MDIAPVQVVVPANDVLLESIDSLRATDSFLIASGYGLDTSFQNHALVVIDSVSGEQLARFTREDQYSIYSENISNKTNSNISVHYVDATDKIILYQASQCRLLTSTPHGTLLLQSALNYRPPKDLFDDVVLELPFQEAQQLARSLNALLSKDDRELNRMGLNASELRALAADITAQTSVLQGESNKRLQFATVLVRGKYKDMKSNVNSLNTKTNDMNLLSVCHCMQEMLRRYGESIKDTAGFLTKMKSNNMHVEYMRLKSFANWVSTPNPLATPSILARGGFYYAPSPHQANVGGKIEIVGTDTCAHFNCNLQLSNWGALEHPQKELLKHYPDDAFAQGRPTCNVPLAYSLVVMPPQHQLGNLPIDEVISAPHTALVLMRSGDSLVSVWDTTVELSMVFAFDARTGNPIQTENDIEKPPANVSNQTPDVDWETVHSVILLPCSAHLGQADDSPDTKKSTFISWCTPGIEVYADKGVYAGTKGYVKEVINQDNIHVYLQGYDDVVSLSLNQIIPLRPKVVGQRAKVLKGEFTGEDVHLLAIQNATTAIVRLISSKKHIILPLNSLASMPAQSYRDSALAAPLQGNCILAVLSAADSATLVTYALTERNMVKLVSSLDYEFHGSVIATAFVRSTNTLIMLCRQTRPYADSTNYTLAAFTYTPEDASIGRTERGELGEKDSLALQGISDDDAPIAMKNVEIESIGEDAVLIVTKRGRVFIVQTDPELKILATYKATLQPEKPDEQAPIFKSFTYLPGEGRLVCVGSDSRLYYFPLLYEENQLQVGAFPQSQPTQEQMLQLLGPTTLENLLSLQNFEQEYLQFNAFPPVTKESGTIKQQMLENGTCVRWQLPEPPTGSTNAPITRDLVFEIELVRIRRLDSLDIELCMALPRAAWYFELDSDFEPKYSLSLEYYNIRKGWLKAIDDFDLSGIISSGDAPDCDDTKIRVGSLPITGNVTARKLRLTFHAVESSPSEDSKVLSNSSDEHTDGRVGVAKRFNYSSDFDENGVFYWIGTNGGKDPWSNPAADGRVRVELSHEKLPSPDMKKSDVLSHKPPTKSMYWGGSAPQWLMVDLGPNYRLECDCYTLRHGYQHANSYLQNWVFQGSNDAETWVTLHEGYEPPFTKGFDTHSFMIKDGKDHFRYFRVLQKGNYAMVNKTAPGSPYMCIAGLELYGELVTESNIHPTPNRVQTLSVRFATLKPSRGYTLPQTIARRQAIAECVEFHRKLLHKTFEADTPYDIRNICIDLLVDIWRRDPVRVTKMATDELTENPSHMHSFLQWNIVKAEKSTTIRAGRFINCLLTTSETNFDTSLLRTCLEMLPRAVDEFEFRDGMNQMLMFIQLCWDCDEQRSLNGCLAVIDQLGKKLYDSRSPLYNILRRNYSLYGHPLELDMFEIPSGGPSFKETPNTTNTPISASAPAAAGMATSYGADVISTNAVEKATNTTVIVQTKEVLEHQLLACSLEFAAARRTLTTLLEEVNTSGRFGPQAKDIVQAYEECLVAQHRYFRVHKKLRKFKPEAFKTDDRKLSRWTCAAEQLFSILNQKYEVAAAHPGSLLSYQFNSPELEVKLRSIKSQPALPSAPSTPTRSGAKSSSPQEKRTLTHPPQLLTAEGLLDLFTKFCVYTTPALRREASRYIINHISLQPNVSAVVRFPRLVLQRFFSRRALDHARPVDAFPQQDVFEALQDIINEDRFRFFYVEDLFSLLEELTTKLAQAVKSDSDDEEETSKVESQVDNKTPLPTLDDDFDMPLISWLLQLLSNTVARAEDNVPVHKGIRCRICNMSPICGVRYRCINCPDYDICENCEEQQLHNKTHVFLKIPTALPTPTLLREPLLPSQIFGVGSESGANESHEIQCDACHKNIKGIRFKCAHCEEFNLCESCEEKGAAEHHTPLHLFLKIRKPSAQHYTSTPTSPDSAQVKRLEPASLDTLLEAAYSGPNVDMGEMSTSSTATAEIPAIPPTTRHLRSIFSVIRVSADIQPISPELIMLSIRLLQSVANQYTPMDVIEDIIKHPQFDSFLNNVATYPSSFIRSAVLQLLEYLVQPATYSFNERDNIQVLRTMRRMLRLKAIRLLRKQRRSTFTFLFELLLIVTTEKDMREEPAPGNGVEAAAVVTPSLDFEPYPIDSVAQYLMTYIAEDVPLTSALNARTWCMVFRLLHFADVSHVIRVAAIVTILHEVLVAAEELQVLLVDDFIHLLNRLLLRSGPELSSYLQRVILDELVESFPEVLAEANILVYMRTIELMKIYLTPEVVITPDSIGEMLDVISQSLPDPVVTYPSDNDRNKLIKECLSLVSLILSNASQRTITELIRWKPHQTPSTQSPQTHVRIGSALVAVIRTPPQAVQKLASTDEAGGFIRRFLVWLSALPMTPETTKRPQSIAAIVTDSEGASLATLSGNTSTTQQSSLITFRKFVSKAELGRAIVSLLKMLSRCHVQCAKTILQMALSTMKNIRPNSVTLAELCSAIIYAEELAYHFLVELDGAEFLFDQLRAISTGLQSSFLSPTFSSVLSQSKMNFASEGIPRQPGSSPMHKQLENFSSVCELLSPRDKQLERLLKESATNTTTPWTYNFRPATVTTSMTRSNTSLRSASVEQYVVYEEDILSIDVALPDNVILHEIRLDCISNYNTNSRFPPFVTVHTGTSLGRLLPVGRFPCKSEETAARHQAPNAKLTASFRFPLPDIKLVRYVRIEIHAPKYSPWIAISRIQLLGQPPLMYAMPHTSDADGPVAGDAARTIISHHLPLKTALSLLEQSTKFPRVQVHLASEILKEYPEHIGTLLSVLSEKTSSAILNITSNVARHDETIADLILRHLLKGTTHAHATLAARMCCVGGPERMGRVNRLAEFVFTEISTPDASISLGSHLTPFLDALSDALAVNRQQGMNKELAVTTEQMRQLFRVGVAAMDGSLLQQCCFRLLAHILQSYPHHYAIFLNDFEKKFDLANRQLDVLLMMGRAGPLAEAQEMVVDGTAAITIFPSDQFSALGFLACSSPQTAQILLESKYLDRLVADMKKNMQLILVKQPITADTISIDKESFKESTAQFQAVRFLETALEFLASVAYDSSIKAWLGEHAFDMLYELCCSRSFGSRVPFATQEVIRQAVNLNPTNQQRIARFLATSFRNLASLPGTSREPSQRDVLLRVAVDLFALSDKVVVALKSVNGTDEEIRALGPSSTKVDPIRLDRTHCHPNLDLDDEQTTVTANANTTTGWRTVLAEKPITQGVRKWQVVLEKLTPTANVMIGVCERSHKLNSYIGQSQGGGKGWSYYGATTGYTYHDGKSDSRYGQKMCQGDVITVILDMDEGTLSFHRNGEDLGVAFRGLAGLELYPAVSLYDVGDRVRFQDTEGTPVDKGPLSEARIETTSPLQFHRTGHLFSLPVTTTLGAIATSLNSDDSRQVVFHVGINGQAVTLAGPTALQTRLGDLRVPDTSGEILDVKFEIVPKSEEAPQTTGTLLPPRVIETGSVLRRFAEEEGRPLISLLSIVDNLLREREQREEEELARLSSPHSTMGGLLTPAISSSFGRPPVYYSDRPVGAPIATWRKWAKLFCMATQIPGLTNELVLSTECRSLLFHIMTIAQRHTPPPPAAVSLSIPSTKFGTRQAARHRTRRSDSLTYRARPESVREISSRLGLIKDYIPAPPPHLLSNPLNPLLNLVFANLRDATVTVTVSDTAEAVSLDVIDSQQQEEISKALVVRSNFVQSGVLGFILSELIPLSDIPPRNPENPAFHQAMTQYKLQKTKAKDMNEREGMSRGTTVHYWAKGTGYAADDTISTWSHEGHIKEQIITANRIAQMLDGICAFLTIRQVKVQPSKSSQAATPPPSPQKETEDAALSPSTVSDSAADAVNEAQEYYLLKDQPALPQHIYALLCDSNLFPLIESYLRNDSLLDMGRLLHLYVAVLRTTTIITQHRALMPIIVSREGKDSIYSLLHKLFTIAENLLRRLPRTALPAHIYPSKDRDSTQSSAQLAPEATAEQVDEITLALEIRRTYAITKRAVVDYATFQSVKENEASSTWNAESSSEKSSDEQIRNEYIEALRPIQFGEMEMFDPTLGEYRHHYKTRIKAETVASQKKLRRLIQELGSLDGLPLHLESSVFLRVDSQRLDVMQCIITGPEGTPYAHGCFLFDIYCPPEYPSGPPLVHFQTTGHGTVRFNPNLYNEGKVCLSLLGTWRGGPNEQWNEKTSTLLQVFVSIQSLILVDKPYFNEPGYESAMNTPKGEAQSKAYNEQIRIATIRWAMVDILRNPPPGFEDVIRTHFRIKRNRIMRDVLKWLDESIASRSMHADRLAKQIEELKEELQKLDPNTSLDIPSSSTASRPNNDV